MSPRFKALGKKVSRTLADFPLRSGLKRLFRFGTFSGWWMISLVGGLEHLDYFSIYIYILGISSSQLNIFQRGFQPSTSSFLGRIPVHN